MKHEESFERIWVIYLRCREKTDWESYWNASHKFTPTLPLLPTHSLLLWRPLILFTPPLGCGGVLFSSHSYTALLFPYFWVEEEEEGRGGGGGGGGSTMFGFIQPHQISDHAEIVIRFIHYSQFLQMELFHICKWEKYDTVSTFPSDTQNTNVCSIPIETDRNVMCGSFRPGPFMPKPEVS